ncbi:beta-carotene 15,15'-dioxygenase, Brp/Blh family [Cryomorpha ignava]|uniref:Beta-carotene 15,15'-dioxygenase, Brp/Blh family n=1 Tax=Cryomorpha ignava TaxID=101383 RepID=A0A7K3WVB1_9FLAO|nr:Brp/Blh family beta-carotene 15,15'-dioxygenase [Cryomorpha ignava]NEN25424.1 beta-carotene 15,15'-dioxygenase, Brp/Blh family [Cryomorpha ignava]
MLVKSTGIYSIMTKAIFVFIASFLLILPFVFNAGDITLSSQLMICAPFLFFLGIPHGAIDNVLFLRGNQIKNREFIGVYLVIIASNIILWMILPSIAYLLFLLLSAYHFGQSQFSHYSDKPSLFYKALYFFWGVSILSGLVYFNIGEIQVLMNQQDEFAALSSLHEESIVLYTFLLATCITFVLLVFLSIKNLLDLEALFMETLVIALVLICFYLMPILIGFTLYFVILHSFKVLREEYLFLNSKKVVNSIGNFVKLVMPFTLLSIGGIALLFGLIYLNILSIPYGYLLLIVISSITLPHVFVMNRFYNLI